MSDEILLRPGVAVGAYPQREEQRSSWLDDLVANTTASLRDRLPRFSFNKRFVQAVSKEGVRLENLGEFELRQFARALRQEMYAGGMTEIRVVSLFALVRMMAEKHVGLRPYDVQVLAGRTMLDGRIVEMETGEGKTLTATFPACAMAFVGVPVHIVTVNDYLAARDADWMRPLYDSLGLTVGVILEGMSPQERRQAYACDVTYCTNKQLVFDYLKDQVQLGHGGNRLQLELESLYRKETRRGRTMLRGLCFAIVDEADSVLVDEARTPLILSSRTENTQEEQTYLKALEIAETLQEPRDFVVSRRDKKVTLTDFGLTSLRRQAKSLSGVWRRRATRETLIEQALMALYVYERDSDYLVVDGEIKIIDEYTGRLMQDRSWERGLHQMIETKEQLDLSTRHETVARISYQRFFRRYLRLSGMTGTAREVTGELRKVYRVPVSRISPNRPARRRTEPDQLFATSEQKWQTVVERVRQLHRQGRPVLIGTRSVAASKLISSRLRGASLAHEVLNASQEQPEAKIIARAGHEGQITVATNMAGRGTDIKLGPGVNEKGGLHVLATERHDARRIDRQLFGRCGRQGDAGSYQAILSLDDELVTHAFGPRFLDIVRKVFKKRARLPNWFAVPVIWLAQRSAELHNSRMRSDLLRLDESLGDLLAFAGARD